MMLRLTGRIHKDCESVRDALERSVHGGESDRVVALGTLLTQLSDSARNHVSCCEDCRIFADELLEVRGMFRGDIAGPQPGPYFMARVMASIADREVQLENNSRTWAAVPRLAYRLSVLASLTILIAGSWLYQRPQRPSTVASVSTEQLSEGLVEGSGVGQDDLLVSPGSR